MESVTANGKMVMFLSGFLGTAVGLVISYFSAVTHIHVLKTQVANINQKILENMDDRYRGADARRDHALAESQRDKLEQMIKQNAHQIEELQALLRKEIERHNAEHRQ